VVSNPDILRIFNVSYPDVDLSVLHVYLIPYCFKYVDKKDVEDIQYITFLLMARAGLRALEYYDPSTQKHGQAHMQARWDSQFAASDQD
jgi:hypothetical protein